jgi:hypothetical protein
VRRIKDELGQIGIWKDEEEEEEEKDEDEDEE